MTINIEKLTYAYDPKGEEIILDIPQWRMAEGDKVLLHGPRVAGSQPS